MTDEARLGERMLIYAHRGSSRAAPENTLLAFERAIADGADGVELDVHATVDGVPVVIHDRDVTRTTTGKGNVDELTLAELRTFDAGGGQRVPTLAEMLDLLAGRLPLDIEVKQAGIEREVLAVLGRYPQATWFVSAFDWGVLRVIRSLDAAAGLCPLAVKAEDSLFAAAPEMGASAVALMAEGVTPDVARRCAEANLGLAVWTVNAVEEARRVRDLGAAVLVTDVPAEIRNGLEGR